MNSFVSLVGTILVINGCGGDVENPSSAGGATGASSGDAQASTTGTTSTGAQPGSSGAGATGGSGGAPPCDCHASCQAFLVEECGFGSVLCDSLCSKSPDCVCGLKYCDFEAACMEEGEGGAGPTSPCEQCVEEQAQVGCQRELGVCEANAPCVDLYNCHVSCDWAPDCGAGCDLMACAACGECAQTCRQTPLAQYCSG